jgi:glycosyltransferase involved in cell wall biosynthesis
MPRVELISNVTHYYYTALALYRSNYLGHYITGPSALDNEAWMQRLGEPFKRLWAERRLQDIPPHLIKRMWLPEIMQKGIIKFGGSYGQSNLIHDELFARRAAAMMDNCDAVHFVNGVGKEASIKAKRNGAKVICDIRQEHPQFQEDILAKEAKKLGIEFSPGGPGKNRLLEEIDLADHIFCPSHYAKRTFVEHGIDDKKLVVCPYGVDTTSFLPRQDGQRPDQFTVAFLGSLGVRKGIHYLLEGYKRAKLKNSRLLLAGPIDSEFRPFLKDYEGLIEVAGRIPHSKVHEFYEQSDVFVLPSLADAYPLVALEAMSSGLPVIVSENTGTAGIIKDGQEGFIVPIRDAQAIADKLVFLHDNRGQCSAMGFAAAAKIKTLNWGIYEKICSDFYHSMFHRVLG